MRTETEEMEERARGQALNDFLVFTLVTVSSLSAGVLHHVLGWRAVNLGVLLPITIILGALLWLRSKQRVRAAAEA